MGFRKLLALLAIAPAFLGVACSAEPTDDDASGEAQGALAEESGPADPGAAQGRDASGAYGTEVWKVTRNWTDKNPATGNTFEKDYSAWVGTFQKTKGFNYGETIKITTPPGAPYQRELDAPTLECADTAIFARVTYASLMGLPFFLKSEGLFAGHFGMVNAAGQQHGTFGTAYRTYANNAAWREGQAWPSDRNLRRKHASSYKSGDETFVEEVPGTKGGAGAWFDEFFVNKRVGHFLVTLVDLFGSVNLAQEGNMFHVEPEATSPGDALLHRHGKYAPIGHTLFVYASRTVKPGRMEIEVVSGSMPARQASWEPHYQSRSYFLSPHAGGPETVQECRTDYNLNYDDKSQCRKEIAKMDKAADAACVAPWEKTWDDTKCVRYQVIPSETTDIRKMGGGIRRFRTPVLKNGRWVNIVPASARDVYIPDTDLERVGARLAKFEQLLDLGSPDERKAAAIATISSYREYIKGAPSTCSKRQAREEAFEDLYRAYSDAGEYDKAKIDKQHRSLEDYVFAELDYDTSRTCCWNSTKREHYDTIMAWAQDDMKKAETQGVCKAPPVFKATGSGDGYAGIRAFAKSKSMPFPEAWTEDEPCKAKDITEDSITERGKSADFCEAAKSDPPPAPTPAQPQP
jgi:hypothetical protein